MDLLNMEDKKFELHPSFPRPKSSKSISPRSDDIDNLSSIHAGSGKPRFEFIVFFFFYGGI